MINNAGIIQTQPLVGKITSVWPYPTLRIFGHFLKLRIYWPFCQLGDGWSRSSVRINSNCLLLVPRLAICLTAPQETLVKFYSPSTSWRRWWRCNVSKWLHTRRRTVLRRACAPSRCPFWGDINYLPQIWEEFEVDTVWTCIPGTEPVAFTGNLTTKYKGGE